MKNISDKNIFFLKIIFNNIHIGNVRIERMINKKKKEATIAIIIGNNRFHNKGIGRPVVDKSIKIISGLINPEYLPVFGFKLINVF